MLGRIRCLAAGWLALTASARGDGVERWKTLEIGRDHLRCRIEGRGAKVLVIGSSIYYPRTFSKNFKLRFEIFYLDMPWFSSSCPNEPVSIDSITALIDRARRQLGLSKVILVGHSIHAAFAAEYAYRHPNSVKKLLLIDAPTMLGSQDADQVVARAWAHASLKRHRRVVDNWKNLNLKRVPAEEQPIAAYLAITPEAYYDADYDARWLWHGVTVNVPLFNQVFTTVFKNYRMFPGNRYLPVPTMAVAGRYDYVYPIEMWKGLGSRKNLNFHVFEHSAHSPMLEESTRFDQLVIPWLLRAESKPGFNHNRRRSNRLSG